MRPILFLSVFIFCAMQSNAQTLPKACVYKISGQASVSKNGKQYILKKKDTISIGDTIKLQKDAVLKIYTQWGKIIETKGPGTFNYIALQKNPNVQSIGISEKFLELIWHDLFKPSLEKTKMSSNAIGGAVGGARRGCTFLIEPLDQTKTSEDTLHFNWKAIEKADFYLFVLQDSNKNEILNLVTKDTSLILLRRGLLKDEANHYYWSITTNNDNSSDCFSAYNFTVTSNAEKTRRIDELVKSYPQNSDLFIYNLQISNILGSNGWYNEAFEYYKKAYEAYEK